MMNTGFTLHYDGVKFGPHSRFSSLINSSKKEQACLTATERLAYCFSQIGALAIRMHNGQSQRADLIQGALDPNYLEHPVESTAKGGDQKDVFLNQWTEMPSCPALSARLEKNALATLGKGKLLNERGQRVLHLNKCDYRGEENLWEKIHASVWHTGISFARQLSEQGFSYICCPPYITADEYDKIQENLVKGNFLLDGKNVLIDGLFLQIGPLPEMYCHASSIIKLDPECKQTFQSNGLVIDFPELGGKAPLGWIMHKKSHKIIPKDLTEDIIRIIRLAKGGYHELSPQEQPLLAVGPKNGLGGVTQSPVFNALYVICNHLEQKFGFDPEKLLGNSIGISYAQVQEFFKKPENVEDFLTGHLLTEMVQPLKVTKEYSSRRRDVPLRLTYPFKTLSNTTKAIAYAYDLHYKETPLLALKHIDHDELLPDISINGELALPSLSFGKQCAAILSTALLVAEQMFLEQILRDAIEGSNPKLLLDILKKTLENTFQSKQLANKLIELAKAAPRNKSGPILGLQFEYCGEMLLTLRKALGFDVLIQLSEKLEKAGILTDEALEEFLSEHSRNELEKSLNNLHRLGNLLQVNRSTSAQGEGSRGINAGLLPLMNKIAPSLVPKSLREDLTMSVPGVTQTDLLHKATTNVDVPTTSSSNAGSRNGLSIFSAAALFAIFVYLYTRKKPE